MAEVVGQIERLLEPILASLGLSLWELEFKKEGPRWMLRVYIDREDGGVTLNDCEAVSRDLGAALDVEDIIPHAYTLEVSSPGLDRTLTKPEHFVRFAGSAVKVKTYQPINGEKVFRGKLRGIEGVIVKIELPDGAVLDIPLRDISKASLEVEF
jgi:ribosome maturation factor RimP